MSTAGLIPNTGDCRSDDKSVPVVRIEEAIFDDDGREIKRETIMHCFQNNDGRKSEHWHYSLDENDKVSQVDRVVDRFDAAGRVLDEQQYDVRQNPKKPQRRTSYTYDSEGRPIKAVYIEDGEVNASTESVYDSKGDAALYTSFDSDGEPAWMDKMTYDEAHHLLTQESSFNGLTYKKRFVYDAEGRVLEVIATHPETTIRTISTYDTLGRLASEKSVDARFPPDFWKEFSYFDNGLIKEECLVGSTGDVIEFDSYAYDGHDHYTQDWHYEAGPTEKPKKFLVHVGGKLQVFGRTNGLLETTYTFDNRGNWVKAVETRLSSYDDPLSEREVTSILYRHMDYR